MKTGTKSLLFGVHQFLWHPFTVLLAWWKLYGRPSWKEAVCIFIHDWGYWGCETMDGRGASFVSDMLEPGYSRHGFYHTIRGADIADALFGFKYRNLVLFHSRHFASEFGEAPSKLCWADKYSMLYDPQWFYLFRARLSGELKEYHQNAIKNGFIKPWESEKVWHYRVVKMLAKMSKREAGLV